MPDQDWALGQNEVDVRNEARLRPWPEGVTRPGTTREFTKHYRRAFDSDPLATFCAGEVDGLIVIVAPAERRHADKLRAFIEQDLDGVVQQRIPESRAEAEREETSAREGQAD